jgi:hypothetical protein
MESTTRTRKWRVRSRSKHSTTLYGMWMLSIVLVWDVFVVAIVLGARRALARMDRVLPRGSRRSPADS